MELTKINQILIENFERAAKKSQKPVSETVLIFKLVSESEFSVFSNRIEPENERNIFDVLSFIEKMGGTSQINKAKIFIVNALKNYALKYNIQLSHVNVLMRCSEKNEISMTIRNGAVDIKHITAEELFELNE